MTREPDNAPRDKERRKKKRHILRDNVEVVSTDHQPLGRIADVHEEGFMTYGATELEVGEVYDLIFYLPVNTLKQSTVELSAICLWQSIAMSSEPESFWHGFQITRISPKYQDVLEQIIKVQSY
ncbi:PilZ domain-containing protein [Sessilibacter sp. MAH2]